MPLPVLLLILATLLPLASFGVLVFVGKRMGNPLAGYVGTAAIAGSFVCSLAAMMLWLVGGKYQDARHGLLDYGGGRGPVCLMVKWLPVGPGIDQDHPGFLDVGVYVDSLTIAMFSMTTLVAALVHVFSIGYMAEDKRFARFFTYLGLFCFSTLGLVIGGTALQIFIFWELVGLCSYLLVGFWYEDKSANRAAIRAFVTNHIGDVGFLIGVGILFCRLGNATLPNVWVALSPGATGQAVHLAGGGVFGAGLLTATGIAFFFSAIARSAQFPLHAWLADATEGPTPANALIHTATMVATGVYLVGRIFPILTPDARLFIAIVGCLTLTTGALIAVVQSDIKRVLAFSTVSQLGYMMLAMGVGSWVGGLFHLITHAFFKALLFLGAGSVIAAARHEREMPHFGGLLRRIPVTATAFGVAVLAIAGTPWLAGYYSGDMIVRHAAAFATLATAAGRSRLYWAFYAVPTATAFVTAFYMTRCWMLTFWGKPRDPKVHEHAHEQPILYMPLIVLAVLSVIGGNLLGAKTLLTNAVKESNNYCRLSDKAFAGFDTAWPADLPEADEAAPVHDAALVAHEHGEAMTAAFRSPLFYAFAVGIGLAFLVYAKGYAMADRLKAVWPLSWLYEWLYHQMYVDELYHSLFVPIVVGLSAFAGFVDRYVVDGVVNLVGRFTRGAASLAGAADKSVIDGAANGAASLALGVSAAVRAPQSGRVRVYVMLLIIVVALGSAGAVVVMMAR